MAVDVITRDDEVRSQTSQACAGRRLERFWSQGKLWGEVPLRGVLRVWGEVQR